MTDKLSAAFAAGPDPHQARQDQAAATGAATWEHDPFLEGIRRLLATGNPADHRRAEQLLAGDRRVSLGMYVASLKAHIDAGGTLPEGVLAP